MALRLVLIAALALSTISLSRADCSRSTPTNGCNDCTKLNIGFYKGLWLGSSTSASVAGVSTLLDVVDSDDDKSGSSSDDDKSGSSSDDDKSGSSSDDDKSGSSSDDDKSGSSSDDDKSGSSSDDDKSGSSSDDDKSGSSSEDGKSSSDKSDPDDDDPEATTVRNINYDSYGWGTPIFQSWAAAKRSESTLSDCCKACKANSSCKFFQFWTADQLSSAPAPRAQCYLLSEAPTGIVTGGAFNWLGGYCNPAPGQKFPPPPPPPPPPRITTASPPPRRPPPIPTVVSLPPPGVKGDPHFTGWDGVHFDFTGHPGKSYCLLSDSKVHVNMHLDGYESANEDGVKEMHSWIKGVGVITLGHTVALFAREGPEPGRGVGYIKRIVVDGKEIYLPEAEDNFATADGEVSVQYLGHKIDGDDDIDIYSVAVVDTITLLLKMRPEIPSLRTDKEAWVHFSLEVLDEQLSQQTHGILGQTLYNYNHPEAAPTGYPVEYSGVVWAWQVVGPDGDRYIQGKPADYATSNLLRSDCRFSQFARRGVFYSALSLACWKNAFVC